MQEQYVDLTGETPVFGTLKELKPEKKKNSAGSFLIFVLIFVIATVILYFGF